MTVEGTGRGAGTSVAYGASAVICPGEFGGRGKGGGGRGIACLSFAVLEETLESFRGIPKAYLSVEDDAKTALL